MRKTIEMQKGRIDDVVKLTAIAFQLPKPISVAWVGGVGIGKSTVAERLALTLGLDFVELYTLRLEPTDIMGVPIKATDPELNIPVIEYALPSAILTAVKRPTLVFWDEFDKGSDDVRRAALELLNNNRLSSKLAFHQRSVNLVALNPPECGGRYTLTEDVVNRLLLLQFPVDHDAVTSGLMSGEFEEITPLPYVPTVDLSNYPTNLRTCQFLVASFLKVNQSVVWAFPTDWDTEPFPTPRAWTKLSRLLAGIECTNLPSEEKNKLRRLAVRGMVGDDAAQEFTAWLTMKDIPEPEEAIRDPKKLPKRLDALALTLANIGSFVASHPEAWLPAWRVALYLDKNLALEDAAVHFALLLKSVGQQCGYDFTEVKQMLSQSNIPVVWLLVKGG